MMIQKTDPASLTPVRMIHKVNGEAERGPISFEVETDIRFSITVIQSRISSCSEKEVKGHATDMPIVYHATDQSIV